MLEGWVIFVASIAYLGLLFAIAYYGDKRADAGRSLIANPYIYALSMAVYATSWTFYGSVGRAASSGIDFLTIYLGPTLTFVAWWFVLRKILRICKAHRITSIADFISSRYGKSTALGGLVTVIAVVGIMPYISLQLKAVSTSFRLLLEYPAIVMPKTEYVPSFLGDTALLVAGGMAAFSILFGTRHIDAAEHHEGMVAAIAFESIVKLLAFLAVGIFVTFGLYDGFGDLFARAAAKPELARLFVVESGAYGQWITLTVLSMAAIICLPRQFQVMVVENVDEDHLRKAVWLFPLYLLAINIFVMPIALAGLLQFPAGNVDADTFVLTVPMAAKQEGLALFAYIGGLSAATAMVIVATVALSTMVCNDLVMPVLLRLKSLRLHERGDLSRLLLAIRRGSIIAIVMLGYLYFRFIGESVTLVSIGLISFAAAAQFAPAILGGIFWKGGTRLGALTGLSGGFAMWLYTLLLPSFARSGWLPIDFVEAGPFGLALLKPYELFGLTGLDHMTHALFWSMLVNIGGLVLVSLFSRQGAVERIQAALFVDVFEWAGERGSQFWRGTATVPDLKALLTRFLGRRRTDRAFNEFAATRKINLADERGADPELVNFAERLLAGVIGAASARVMVGTVAKAEAIGIDEVMKILDETSQVIEHSHQLEEKQQELETATEELREANTRLQELDRLKDDFISTVSHELRTPLTSIRSFTEILFDNPALEREERERFLGIIVKESERLTRLVNQTLDLAKMEAGRMEWRMQRVGPRAAIEEAVSASGGLFEERGITLDVSLPMRLPQVYADRDQLIQVVLNLLSNAANYCAETDGAVRVWAGAESDEVRVGIEDNGPGIAREARSRIFEKFQQAGERARGRSGAARGGAAEGGTGLGLSICRQIVEHFGGRIWVESRPGGGAHFIFAIPTAAALARADGTRRRISVIARLLPLAGRRLKRGSKREPEKAATTVGPAGGNRTSRTDDK
ncbi:MAG: sensor histidine kinase [Alphaproteobacteria bacterium]|nr:sensor histidine kinase [Alphaproteobacteria bacterium]